VANDLAGRETNPALMARKFFQYVIDKSDHYSKFGPSPKGLCLGSAKECMLGTGDCCTTSTRCSSRSAARVHPACVSG